MLFAQPYKQSARLTDLPNINSQTASQLSKVGIISADNLLNGDPYTIFEVMLKKVDPNLSRQDLANIVGAYKGCHWNNVLSEAIREFRLRQPKHVWIK